MAVESFFTIMAEAGLRRIEAERLREAADASEAAGCHLDALAYRGAMEQLQDADRGLRRCPHCRRVLRRTV